MPRFCAHSRIERQTGEKTNWAIKRRDFDMTRSKSIFMSIIFGKELSNFFFFLSEFQSVREVIGILRICGNPEENHPASVIRKSPQQF